MKVFPQIFHATRVFLDENFIKIMKIVNSTEKKGFNTHV